MSFEFTDELKKKIERVDELSRMSLVYGVVDEEKTTDGVLVWKYAVNICRPNKELLGNKSSKIGES